jgi:6-phospho-beta-glucosidase
VSAAWRSWPAIERWLQAIRAHAPTALVLMMSSPVGILVRAARTRFPDLNCVGVCEVPYVALRDIAAQLEVALESIRFGYVGVNHLGWLYSVQARVGGGDAGGRDAQGGRGAWVSDWAHHPGRPGFPSAALIEEWGGIPTKYLRLHFDADTMLASQKSLKTSRASELQGFQNSAWASYATASSEQLQARVAMRSTPWYSHAIVPLLRGLRDGNAPGPFFLSAPNNGHSIGFAADAVLEIACRVTNGAIERMPSSVPPPARIAELVAAFCDHERVATLAVVERDRSLLEAALRLHPWVARISNSGRPLAPRLAAEILRQDGFAGSVGAHEQGERASGHLVDRAGATLE